MLVNTYQQDNTTNLVCVSPLGKVVNIPLQLALRGGMAWISGAAAKAMNYRTTSVAGIEPEDLRNMRVVQLEEGDVGPQREHIDFKAKITTEMEEKKSKYLNRYVLLVNI